MIAINVGKVSELRSRVKENPTEVKAKSHSVPPIFAFFFARVTIVAATQKIETIKVPKGKDEAGNAQQKR